MKSSNISKISFAVCFVIALVIVTNYERNYPVYHSVKSKILDVIEPGLTASSSGIYAINNLISKIGNIFTIFEENKKLKERNDFLEDYFYLYKQSEGENKELKRQLNFTQELEYQYVNGQVISRSNNYLHQQITINIGATSNVKKWQMALSENNLVGRVIDVNNYTANILLITDYSSRIPAIGVNSRTKFITGGQANNELSSNYLNEKQLQEHELVITSGDNELILPNIIIGTAYKKDNSYYIKPNIDFSQIEFVQILQP